MTRGDSARTVALRAVTDVGGLTHLVTDAAMAAGRRAVPGESDLAVLVLQTSWALADAAHDLPAGRMSAQRREELADTLQALGYVLRVGRIAGYRGGAGGDATGR